MKYNKNSPFEKSPNECPRKCAECAFFKDDIIRQYGGICTANGCRSHTYDFSRPTNRPLPMPLNCFWWYMNNVWEKVSETKVSEYREERLHYLVAWEMRETLDTKERISFMTHVQRPGGFGLIDFSIYPQAKTIYEELKTKEARTWKHSQKD